MARKPNPTSRSSIIIAVVALLALAFLVAAPRPACAVAGRYTISNLVVYDIKTKLTWQRAVSPTRWAWADARSYCGSIGAQLGGTGWRLPTVKELMTIVDDSQAADPLIDPVAFPGTPSTVFWASTLSAGSPTTALGINFLVGVTAGAAVTTVNDTRCVR